MRAGVIILLFLSSCSALLAQTDVANTPKLLLTPQRLRRLKRDRERDTFRWQNFEARVESAPDSPERGFELALYYAVTHDANSGRQAVEWALAHRCELRQVALVLDWVADQLNAAQRNQLSGATCKSGEPAIAARDGLFLQVALEQDSDELIAQTAKPLISRLQSGEWRDPVQLYAAFEYIYVVRSTQRTDLRENAARFFSALPTTLLLSLKPEQVENPGWRMHVAALALVGLDPNLPASQYLQGWAMEEAQTVREGPGVAYEFLWADPYLPGIAYQNLDPWSYDADGNLFARTDWDQDACWAHISRAGVDQENCPPAWQQKTMGFGRLTLLPMTGACVQLPKRKIDEAAIVSRLQPGQMIYYRLNNELTSSPADAAGLWKPPGNAAGKVCTSPDTLKIPPAHKTSK